MKKMFILLFVLILLCSALPLSAAAAEADVEALIAALPDADTVQSLSLEEQQQVYTQTQAAYDAYQALSPQEQDALEGAEETFDELFGYFNTLVMPLEEAVPAEEEKKGIPWHYTALILALITTFLQNRFIFNRRR